MIKVCFSLLLIICILSKPTYAHAGFFSSLFGGGAQASETVIKEDTAVIHNSQTIPLPESSINPDLKSIKEAKTITIVSNEALLPNNSPLDTDSDLEKYASSEKISTYIVKKGDNLDGIAKSLKISKDSIIASNTDLKKSDLLKIGQKLVIFGLKSDTVTKLAETEKVADAGDKPKTPVKEESTPKKDEGPMITINTDLPSPSAPQVQTPVINTPIAQVLAVETPVSSGQPEGTINGNYIWPFPAGIGRVSQGRHADNAFDFAAPKNTPILAIQSGTVLIVHSGGWNGGFGKYVVINFDDGRQAIFGHMNKTNVEEGQVVKQGDIIGFVGTTGSSTGNHTHVGFHGNLPNPYLGLKVNSTSVDHD